MIKTLLAVLASVSLSYAQTLRKFNLVDAETKVVIPFASIHVSPNSYYVVPSVDGTFELASKKKTDKIQITITALGYESYSIEKPLREIPKKIYLFPSVTELNEVVLIESYSANYIIQKVQKGLKQNYSSMPFEAKHFLRKKIVGEDSTFFDLELIGDVFHRGYHQGYRETQNVLNAKWNTEKIKKPLNLFSPFLIQAYQVNLKYKPYLDKNKYKAFTFVIKDKIDLEEKRVYVIDFYTEKTNYKYTHSEYNPDFSGTLYINEEDFAVLKTIEIKKYAGGQNIEDLEDSFPWSENFKTKEILQSVSEINFQKNSNDYYYQSHALHNQSGVLIDEQQISQLYQESSTHTWFGIKTTEADEIRFRKEILRVDKAPFDPDFWKQFHSN